MATQTTPAFQQALQQFEKLVNEGFQAPLDATTITHIKAQATVCFAHAFAGKVKVATPVPKAKGGAKKAPGAKRAPTNYSFFLSEWPKTHPKTPDLMKEASAEWKTYTKEQKDDWRERAKASFEARNAGAEGADANAEGVAPEAVKTPKKEKAGGAGGTPRGANAWIIFRARKMAEDKTLGMKQISEMWAGLGEDGKKAFKESLANEANAPAVAPPGAPGAVAEVVV